MLVFAMALALWKRRDAASSPHDVRAIYQAHGAFVWKTLARMGVPEPDLLDCSQEVFMVVHRRLADREGTSSITTWLYGICLRVAAGYRRRAFRRYEQPSDALPEEADVDGDRAPDASVLREEGRATLVSVLNRMPPNARVVFVMFELDELSCPDIAAQLGCPLGTVHTRLRAARKVFEEAVAALREASTTEEAAR